jgi:predicted nucleotidyltransferase
MPDVDFQDIISSPVLTYEEGLRFFKGKGMLNETLRKLAKDLEDRGIDYSVIGAVALNQHGYRRFTEDIDLLLTREGLKKFQNELVGLGYRPAFEGATKKFRTTAENVTVEIITAGEYPGDGKEKPVQFENPTENQIEIDGIKTLSLEKIVELKLASGMTAPHRLKDLADIQEIIKIKGLKREFAEKLNPFVRKKFIELQESVAESEK